MYIVYNGAWQGLRASIRFIQNFALSKFVLMRFPRNIRIINNNYYYYQSSFFFLSEPSTNSTQLSLLKVVDFSKITENKL